MAGVVALTYNVSTWKAEEEGLLWFQVCFDYIVSFRPDLKVRPRLKDQNKGQSGYSAQKGARHLSSNLGHLTAG